MNMINNAALFYCFGCHKSDLSKEMKMTYDTEALLYA